MDSNSPQLHGGPVVKILASIVVGMDSIPGWVTKILQATVHGQKFKKKKK